MGYIKQAGGAADGGDFADDAPVLHRHIPAAERHHPGAQGKVSFIKGGAQIGGGGISGRHSQASAGSAGKASRFGSVLQL